MYLSFSQETHIMYTSNTLPDDCSFESMKLELQLLVWSFWKIHRLLVCTLHSSAIDHVHCKRLDWKGCSLSAQTGIFVERKFEGELSDTLYQEYS